MSRLYAFQLLHVACPGFWQFLSHAAACQITQRKITFYNHLHSWNLMELILLQTSHGYLIGICEQHYTSPWRTESTHKHCCPESGHVEGPFSHPSHFWVVPCLSIQLSHKKLAQNEGEGVWHKMIKWKLEIKNTKLKYKNFEGIGVKVKCFVVVVLFCYFYTQCKIRRGNCLQKNKQMSLKQA